MKLLAVVLLFANLGVFARQSGCECKKAKEDQTTYGSSTHVTLDERTVKQIEGQVNSYGRPIEGVLVEVFTHPDLTANGKQRQKRVAACLTGKDGQFCFSGIRAGKYELKISKPEWEFASGILMVNPKKRHDAEDRIIVHLALAI
jgi:protocatechuate 3,4-dioxygenase beta subunit